MVENGQRLTTQRLKFMVMFFDIDLFHSSFTTHLDLCQRKLRNSNWSLAPHGSQRCKVTYHPQCFSKLPSNKKLPRFLDLRNLKKIKNNPNDGLYSWTIKNRLKTNPWVLEAEILLGFLAAMNPAEAQRKESLKLLNNKTTTVTQPEKRTKQVQPFLGHLFGS